MAAMVARSGSELRVRLRKPLERAIRAGHPWVYRDALEPFEAEAGAIVRVTSKSGGLLGRGLAEHGPIAVRVFTTDDEPIDAALFARRFDSAFALRARIVPQGTDAYRLLHGEGDRLPGIVCDRYGSYAVLKLDGEAAGAWQARLVEWLRAPLAALGIDSLLTRAGGKGTPQVTPAWGLPPPEELVVDECSMRLSLSLSRGQKTGLFLDHRESRRRVRELASGLRVLNLYGYTGGFSVAAGLGGAAHVTTVDSAAPALEHARRSWELNGLSASRHTLLAADVPETLRALAAQGQRYELVIADPPNFAPNETAKRAALESYAALHAASLGLAAEDGFYLAASCSSHVSQQEFLAGLREGERRARRSAQLLERWSAPADHPRLVAFPEGDYLKVALLCVR
jgi:23S rRNA (cytosine1962-C5)-methyltransferase